MDTRSLAQLCIWPTELRTPDVDLNREQYRADLQLALDGDVYERHG